MGITGKFVRENDTDLKNSYVNIGGFRSAGSNAIDVMVNVFHSKEYRDESKAPVSQFEERITYDRGEDLPIFNIIYRELKNKDQFSGFSDL